MRLNIDGKHYIDVPEATERFGYSERHLTRLVTQGKIDGEKVHGKWLLREGSVHLYKIKKARKRRR